MPSEPSVRKIEDVDASMSSDAPINPAQKGAATLRRHAQDRRAESLRRIDEQIAEGTLVIRQMTAAERIRAI